jgi:hypothetical protein
MEYPTDGDACKRPFSTNLNSFLGSISPLFSMAALYPLAAYAKDFLKSENRSSPFHFERSALHVRWERLWTSH